MLLVIQEKKVERGAQLWLRSVRWPLAPACCPVSLVLWPESLCYVTDRTYLPVLQCGLSLPTGVSEPSHHSADKPAEWLHSPTPCHSPTLNAWRATAVVNTFTFEMRTDVSVLEWFSPIYNKVTCNVWEAAGSLDTELYERLFAYKVIDCNVLVCCLRHFRIGNTSSLPVPWFHTTERRPT